MVPVSEEIIASTIQQSCTLTCILMYAVPILIVLALLKKYFSGGVFNIPDTDLSGKYAVVTGGNSGIGAETVKELSKLGCNVIIGARNGQTAEQLIKSIRSQNSKAKVEFIELDLTSKASIQSFSKNVHYKQIDFLVNNAGVMWTPQRKLTKDGFQMQWGVNHIGHFYLTYLLWSKIAASPSFRVVSVASRAHKDTVGLKIEPYPNWENANYDKNYPNNDYETYNPKIAYSRSKLYNVLFIKALAEKIGKRGIVASLHPGVVRTDLFREVYSTGLKGKITGALLLLFYPILWLVLKSPSQGNQTTMFSLLSDKVQSGRYYADCAVSGENTCVNKQNWDQLWKVSQQKLGVKFNP